MKVAITGASGLFGQGLVCEWASAGHQIFPLNRTDANITDAAAVRAVIGRIRPDLIIHPAGNPDIDSCEENPGLAWRVNVEGTRNVADAARATSARLVLISSDAVFDGTKPTPYVESDPLNPPTVYGRTKVEAERIAATVQRHWIIRVSVLFGPGKTNFVEKGLRRIAAGENYLVAADQLGSTTYTLDAARTLLALVDSGARGVFHVSNLGPCTREELACKGAELAGLDPDRVVGVPMAQMGRPAPRLKYAVMEHAGLRRAGVAIPRPWQEALAEYVSTLKF